MTEFRKWLGLLDPRVLVPLLAMPPLVAAGFIGAMHRNGWRL